MLVSGDRLDTSSVPVRNRLAAYSAAINSSLITDVLSDQLDADFKSYLIGDLNFIWLRASARRSRRTPKLIRQDQIDRISFQCIVSGRASGHTNSRLIDSHPGTVLALDFAQPFVIEDQEAREIINLAVPRAQVAHYFPDPGGLHGHSLAGPCATMFAGFMRSLVPNMADLSATSGDAIATVCSGLLTLLLAEVRQDHAGGMPPTIDRAIALIDAQLGSPMVTPEWLAQRLRISRGQLYGMFRSSGGVAKFVWHRRLEKAREALRRHDDVRKIAEIAYSVGFGSASHFARSYAATFGLSPRAERTASRNPVMATMDRDRR